VRAAHRGTRHGTYYAATAYVPPRTAETGLASFILRNFDAGARRSGAEGRWMLAGGQGRELVQPGSVIAVTEGARVVAYFTVQHVAGRSIVPAAHPCGPPDRPDEIAGSCAASGA